jgi:WD40 repeat protein
MSDDPIPPVFLKLDTGTHTSDIVQLLVTPDGRRLISAGECTVRVWDALTRRPWAVLLGQVSGRSEEAYGSGNVLRMALSPADGRSLVVLKDVDAPQAERSAAHSEPRQPTEVQVFDIETGNLRSRFLHEGSPTDLDFSADGRYLAMAGWGGQVQVYAARDVLQAGFKRVPRPLTDRCFATAALDGTVSAAVRFIPAPRRRTDPWALVVAVQVQAPRARRGAAKGRPASQPAEGALQWAQFAPASGLRLGRREVTDAVIEPATLSVNDEWAVVAARGTVKVGRQSLGQVLCHLHQGSARDRLYTEAPPAATAFSPTGRRLAVGLSAPMLSLPGQGILPLQAFTVSSLGFEVHSTYHGHDDAVHALAFMADDLVASAGGDNQSIHFWGCTSQIGQGQAQIRGVGRTLFDARVTPQRQVLFGTVPDRLMSTRRMGRLSSFCLKTLCLGSTDLRPMMPPRGLAGLVGRWVVFNLSGRAQLVPIRHGPSAWGDDLNLPPDLSLFVGSDDEWVIWTRSGYYESSPLGAGRMGYHVNRGVNQEALYLASDRFKDFHRPDIVRAVIAHGTEARARAAGVAIPPLDVAGRLPPVIELQNAEALPDRTQARLRFSVLPLAHGSDATRVWVLRNGRFAWTTPSSGPGRQRRFDLTLPMGPGRNVFSLRAENATGRAVAIDREFQGPPLAPGGPLVMGAPGKLFLLSVGVSNFQAAGSAQAQKFGIKPLRCAHRDAIAVHNALACGVVSAQMVPRRPHRNGAFEAVQAQLLVDEQATKSAIRQALVDMVAALQARAHKPGAERDVLVLFLAGHGLQFVGDPDLYFLNHDSDLNRMETGLSLTEVGEMLAVAPAEVVVLIDTCHSGMAGSGINRGLGPDEVARRLQEVSERSMYVLSAARADEIAQEGSTQGHGVFTAALLATLQSRRYLQRGEDGRLSLSMASLMAGLQAEAPRITQALGKPPQTPVFRLFGDVLPLTIYRR